MRGVIAATFIAAGWATLIGTEVRRSVVHRNRERVHGIGGTQDIAKWGMLVASACFLGAVICGGLWVWHR